MLRAAGEAPVPADATDPLIGWINYGVMGLLIIGLGLGVFWVKPAVDNLKQQITDRTAERDKAEARVDAMAEVYQTQLLPSLNKFLTTVEILMPLLQKSIDRGGGDKQ